MASQRFLIEHLSPLLPEAHFFAEEQEENKMAPGWNWVIDPIDGTPTSSGATGPPPSPWGW